MSAEFQSWWRSANLPGDPYERQTWCRTVEVAFELGRSLATPAPGAPGQEAQSPELTTGAMGDNTGAAAVQAVGAEAKDAARWRMLPAFFEEYQIDAMKLYRDIDAALPPSGAGEKTS